MVERRVIAAVMAVALLTGCFDSKPTQYDGRLTLDLMVAFEGRPLPGVVVNLRAPSFDGNSYQAVSDSGGCARFEHLFWADFRISVLSRAVVVTATDSTRLDTITVIGDTLVTPGQAAWQRDTLRVIASGAQPGLKINEIYYCGPPNDVFYFYDQFIELYNSSDDTVYLDGMIICRMAHMLANVTYIFQFPGVPLTGRQYPVRPGQFVVVAQDAIDHTQIPLVPLPGSVDLSNADWEFVNARDYGDSDNPNIPNLHNLKVGHNRDFMINLAGDVILIADGSDVYYLDGIDLESVVDCVEYFVNSVHIKDIETELDRGWAGVGMIKYSGSSIERIVPGFDSNNSTVDFVIIKPPTPGYHHATVTP